MSQSPSTTRRTEEVEIGGRKYRLTQLPFKPARSLLMKLTGILGPATASAILQDGSVTRMSGRGLAAMVHQLTSSLDDAEVESIGKALFAHGFYVNSTGHEVPLLQDGLLDAHFEGDALVGYYELLQFALGLNYASFLDKAQKALAGLVTGKAPSPEQSPSASGTTGTSGE